MQTLKVPYDTFSDEWFKKIEKIVLGDYKFNEEQKKFIHYCESAVIKAGPGSGKTTALAAKVALLLKKIEVEGSLTGVCVITHTNSAVDEILKVLKKLGYKDIPHPHFIGTVNEFFNKYGMLPFLKRANKGLVDIYFSEEKILKKYFRNELAKKHPWFRATGQSYIQNSNGVIERLINSHLYFDTDGKLNTETFQHGSFDKYKDDYLFSKKESWKKGLFHVNDTFSLAQKYFKFDSVKRRLQGRFKYLLMDEFQDVSPLALQLLKKVFLLEGNIFQMIGDSNQHIAYSNPEVSTKGFKTYYLNQTNRFGDSIATVLNKMFQDNLKPTESKKSLQPILLLYKDPKKLSDCFKLILNQKDIMMANEHTAMLVAARSHAQILGGKINKTNKQKLESTFQKAKNEIYRLLAEETKFNIQSIKRELQREYASYDLKINKTLIEYYRGTANHTLIRDSINLFLNVFGSNSKINKTNGLFRILEELKEVESISPTKISDKNSMKTIHDLKGQTLKANMVYLYKNSREEHGFLKSYTSLLEPPRYYNDINKRVVFVAMSRATTFLAVALHVDTYDSLTEEAQMKLKEDFIVQRDSKILKEHTSKSI
ncbi:UvrD-helicase domain-containing protein [Lentibacillus salicampi]|uniref:ATP-dependent helicase n=1 Tax=Lentibacillus salicampi TaxID=175306 RepID=A0A4Y9ABC8_9BACI|nr:UvrD-helicase domain-containing protein [Lentibacillus salicampi]TFJ93096.1 ATP-dependent helicase [Lentibacillus salicampi]